jgi:uncharacterized protein YndB with AHSA1/START domain
MGASRDGDRSRTGNAVDDVITSVTFRRRMPASPDVVFAALTSCHRTGEFHLGLSLTSSWEPLSVIQIRPADSDEDVAGLTGQVLAVEPDQLVSYVLDEVSGAATYLTWTLRPTAGGTIVRLRVDETDAYAGCEDDLEDVWLPVLERLVVMLTPAAPASRASGPAR